MSLSARSIATVLLTAAVLAGCASNRNAMAITELDPGYESLRGNPQYDVVSGRFETTTVGYAEIDGITKDALFIKAAIAQGERVVALSKESAEAARAPALAKAAIASLKAAGARVPSVTSRANRLLAAPPQSVPGTASVAEVLKAAEAAKADVAKAPGEMTNLIVALVPVAGK